MKIFLAALSAAVLVACLLFVGLAVIDYVFCSFDRIKAKFKKRR